MKTPTLTTTRTNTETVAIAAAVSTSKAFTKQPGDPERWAAAANQSFPSGPALTPWFAGTITPARAGWYERLWGNGSVRQYWNGSSWAKNPQGEAIPNESASVCWRGLSAPARL